LALTDLKDPSWVADAAKADKIAAAVLEWAISMGASSFCHWFQPMVRIRILRACVFLWGFSLVQRKSVA
jgi:glutamine synthetase type III